MLNIYNVNKILEVSLPCGSGKTMATCDYIARNQEKRFIVVCPTRELSAQWTEQLKKRCVRYLDKVDSSECIEQVGASIEKAIADHNSGFDDGARVIIITQAALKTAKIMHMVNDWTLITDEIVDIDDCPRYSITRHHSTLLEYLNIDESFEHPTLFKLKIINKCFRKLDDSFLDVIKPLLQDMDSYFDAFVEKNNWNDIIDERIVSEDKEKNFLSVLTMLTPKLFENFKEVITLGANLEKSLLRRWFEVHHGIRFRPHLEILRNKEYQHTNGHRLTIHYLMEQNYSKTIRNKDDADHGTFGKRLHKMADEMLDAGYLLVQNNDIKENLNGVRIPVFNMGSNAYSDIHEMYYTAALNRKPAHIRMLNALGFSNDIIREATLVEKCYQSIMRTSLRNPEATEPVTLVVNDLFTANAVARLFPNCSVVPHKDIIRRVVAMTQAEKDARQYAKKKAEKPKKVPMTPAEKQKAYREKKKLEKAA